MPRSWPFPLRVLKLAGVLGLLVGIAVPPIGVAAAVGLVLFLVGGVIAHLRAHAEALSHAYPGTLLLLAAGAPNRAIAGQLVVTPETVRKHLSHIFDRLG